jgi:hypothetical protein
MKKLVIFLILVLGIFYCDAQSYIREEYVCAGSSFKWQLDASNTSTIIIKTEYADENVYDTIVGNEITLYPNDTNPAYYKIVSINDSVLPCTEILYINVLPGPEASITINSNNLHISMNDGCNYVRIINTTNNSLFYAENWGTPPDNININLGPGNYNAIFTDDSILHCRVTIPITIP